MISRRQWMQGSAALTTAPLLGGCFPFDEGPDPLRGIPALKDIAPFPMGTCAMTGQLDDPAWSRLALTHFNQITPEWEMKMEYILTPDGYRFDASDRIADFCRAHGMHMHGTTLVWYSQGEEAFRGLSPADFRRKFDDYIATVAGRYRGKVRGWDVVNEAVAEDGNGLRSHHWSEALGEIDHMVRAFEQARLADAEAVLFINDYNLENNPAKGDTFLRLVERLLKAGAPVGGIGSQSHLDIEIREGQIGRFIQQAAQFGLPIHISELDASLKREGGMPDVRTVSKKISQQTDRVKELTESFYALPANQRYALTLWGVRDTDSWLRRPPHDDGKDSPLAFEASGQPTAMGRAIADSLSG
ncbi:endo-1,4-beta-xylanase [Brevundimonas sp.]|uniref:endo-1,4-beta-xylanase n=1 Tax=Brevundimonas sp. TaxID=1871086 RepID=UPI00289E39A5|nr:endo-1,4-beta-xylanase [Brevundimonas sp.]